MVRFLYTHCNTEIICINFISISICAIKKMFFGNLAKSSGKILQSSEKLQEGFLGSLLGSKGVSGPSVSQPTVFCVYLFRRGDAVI